MDDRQKLQHLFMFDLWCTRKLCDYLDSAEPFEEKTACLAFLSHIVNAQQIWFSRVIEFDLDETDTWDEYPSEDIRRMARKTHRKWMDLVADHEVDLNTEIFYKNLKGVGYQNPLWQICHHLIIHGQHHRAQISLLLRKSGLEPPAIDYIHYARTQPDLAKN
jgi:uncharacterized damage-inducible protein DinB